jgi:hypothetical protein
MADENKPPHGGRPTDHEVGYARPPKHSQFKPGKSGNPQGRPKGTKNLKTDLAEELSEKIVVHEGGNSRQISKQRAVVKSLVARTLKGDGPAARSLLPMMMRLLDTGEGTQPEETEELHADELEILEAYKERILQSDEKEPPASATNDEGESS